MPDGIHRRGPSLCPDPVRSAMPIIVDGYNFAFANEARGLRRERAGLEALRTGAIRLLSQYARTRGAAMEVVFDGDRGRESVPVNPYAKGFSVIYSGPSADEEIAARVRRHAAPGNLVVVTSDRELGERVRSAGASTRDSRGFFDEAMRILGRGQPGCDGEPRSKYEGPDAAETEYWLEVFGDLDAHASAEDGGPR